jgi:Tol biopolymer transport system component
VLAFSRDDIKTGSDIWVLQASTRQARPFLQTPFNEDLGRFSRDGRLMAYVSNESGRNEVYVVAFPDRGHRWQISTDGGSNPVWAPSGRELFYQSRDDMMQVAVVTQPTFAADKPRLLFKGAFTPAPDVNYDITADGQRFLMLHPVEPAHAMTQLQVVSNWLEELKQRVATK